MDDKALHLSSEDVDWQGKLAQWLEIIVEYAFAIWYIEDRYNV